MSHSNRMSHNKFRSKGGGGGGALQENAAAPGIWFTFRAAAAWDARCTEGGHARRWFGTLLLVCCNVAFAAGCRRRGIRVQINLNQSYIESVTAEPALDVSDPMSVFASVFASLPEDVHSLSDGKLFSISISTMAETRFCGQHQADALDRDKGIVHFAYFPDYTEWGRGGDLTYRALDRTSGVGISKLAELVYALDFDGKTVVFRLNDLSTVKPGPAS